MTLPVPEQEDLKKTATDFAAQIKAGQIRMVPRLKTQEARDFVRDQLITVHGIDPRLFGDGFAIGPTS